MRKHLWSSAFYYELVPLFLSNVMSVPFVGLRNMACTPYKWRYRDGWGKIGLALLERTNICLTPRHHFSSPLTAKTGQVSLKNLYSILELVSFLLVKFHPLLVGSVKKDPCHLRGWRSCCSLYVRGVNGGVWMQASVPATHSYNCQPLPSSVSWQNIFYKARQE